MLLCFLSFTLNLIRIVQRDDYMSIIHLIVVFYTHYCYDTITGSQFFILLKIDHVYIHFRLTFTNVKWNWMSIRQLKCRRYLQNTAACQIQYCVRRRNFLVINVKSYSPVLKKTSKLLRYYTEVITFKNAIFISHVLFITIHNQ